MNNSKTDFGPEIFENEKKYIMHWLSPFFYTEAKFESLQKEDTKQLATIEMKFFRITAGTPFLTTIGMKNFWKT